MNGHVFKRADPVSGETAADYRRRQGIGAVASAEFLARFTDSPTTGPPGRVEGHAGHVGFRIRDNGIGMTVETLQHAGEPFFTTKPVGAGFGLGLFLARTFAERWGGSLTLTSSPSDGTTATLLLPAASEGLQA